MPLRGRVRGLRVLGDGVEEQRQPPHQLLTLIPTIDRMAAVCGEELVEGVAAVQVLLDDGDQGGPGRAAPPRGGAVGADELVELLGPAGRDGLVEAGGDGGLEVRLDPPPQGGGAVLVRQRTRRGRGCQQVAGVDAGAVDGGEPSGEDGQERILCRRRAGGADGRSPFRHGGGAAVGERRVECPLVGGGGPVELRRSGGSAVGGVDAGGGPPDRDLFDQRAVGPGSWRQPGRRIRCRIPHPAGEVADQVGPAVQVGTPVGMLAEGAGDCG